VARSQVLVTCGSFESSAIHELPTGLRSVDPASGAVRVRGMTEAVVRAVEERALFSELGLAWARPGREVAMAGYYYFPAGPNGGGAAGPG
jgi:hypothetical protein